MTCQRCSDQIGLPSTWDAHARLGRPGSASTSGYASSGNQKLYACNTCGTVLRKGLNTGWALALRTAPPSAPVIGTAG